MLFRRKSRLRNEFDERLLDQLNELKIAWSNQKSLVERSFDPSPETVSQAKLAEAKYFYLFKEAKKRNVRVRK